MNIKEIVQTPYTTNPKFTPIDSVKFKDYLQEHLKKDLTSIILYLAICHLNQTLL